GWEGGCDGWREGLCDMGEGVAQAVRADRQLCRPCDLGVVDHRRAGLEPVDYLLDDLEGLVHFCDPHREARPRVAAVVGRYLEVECLVTEVGIGLAEIPRQPGRA